MTLSGPTAIKFCFGSKEFSRRALLLSAAMGACRGSACSAEIPEPHITAITFSPDGKLVLCGSCDGVTVRDRKTQSIQRRIVVELDSIHDLQFAPDGQRLAVAGGIPGETGAVQFLSWPEGSPAERVENHDDVVNQVAFSADGSRWITASTDEVCSSHQRTSEAAATRFTKHSRAVLAVVVLPDGETAVSASRDETLRVWSLRTGESVRTLHNHSQDVHALALKPGHSGLPMVASASDDGTIRFWQPTIGRMMRIARVPSVALDIAWADGGAIVVAVCRDGKLRLIDPVGVKVVETVHVGDDWLYAVAVDPTDSRRVAIGGARGLARVIRI